MDDGTWAEHQDGLCVTLVKGKAGSDVIATLCPSDVQAFSSADESVCWVRDSESYDRTWLAVGHVGGVAFAWEDNGFQGADKGVLQALSAGTRAVSMFWNVNAVMAFTLAEGGQVVRQFDPLFHDDDPSPVAEIGSSMVEEAGLNWESGPRLSGLRLQARLMDLDDDANPDWLARQGVTFWGHHF
jgi:hypothetical protein